ncbi:MAG: biotin-dependent carboxyltransferase family protein [Colwellia sp.]
MSLTSFKNVSLGLLVKQSGMLSLLQDGGRFGAFNIGLTNGGPLDRPAFHWANRLCGNDVNVTAIEISVGGLILTAQIDTVIAVTGAKMPLTINGIVKELWRSYQVKAGDTIELGFSTLGTRCYLAVSGGFIIPTSFGSTATVCREKVGGLTGDKLAVGEVLPCEIVTSAKHYKLAEQDQPIYSKNVVLHTIPSYQQHHFSSYQQRLFFSSEYSASQNCDRMGYRLEGQKIDCDINGILSEGICHGAVQIPADGQPIVLMNDRQTIGGYPKIGAVMSLDTAKLAQLGAGDKVHFEPISMEKAHNLIHLNASLFKRTTLKICQ